MQRKETSRKRTPKIVAPEELKVKTRSFLNFDDILKQFEEIVTKSNQITKKERANLMQGISLVKKTLAEIKSRRTKSHE